MSKLIDDYILIKKDKRENTFYQMLPMCKGSMRLGTGCGVCEKCQEELRGICVEEFPTAKIARNRINKGETIKQNKELEEIKNLIIQEIDKGNCSVYLSNRSILNSTRVFLENNGYKIETGGRYNEVNTVISW